MNGTDDLILGMESSCDETCAAVVSNGRTVLSSAVASQFELHAKFGGIVPEIACRAHIECINVIIEQVLVQASVQPQQLCAVAAVNTPGLVGSLLIGFTAAKTLAWVWDKPLIAIDHLQAHGYAAAMAVHEQLWPALALIVSGGHTAIYLCHNPLDMQLLGSTIDDAAGEAFDKVANILDLGYPGGPAIENLARQGNPTAVNFPRAMLGRDSLDFSFSGLKTAVLYHVRGTDLSRPDSSHLSLQQKADIAASFQAAVVDVLVSKTMLGSKRSGLGRLILGGGVAANGALRSALTQACRQRDYMLFLPPMKLCTDNAAMVAGLAWHKFLARQFANLGESVST